MSAGLRGVGHGHDSTDPDDNARGGDIIVRFLDPVVIGQVSILDIDDNSEGSSVELFDDSDVLLDRIVLQELGNNSFQQLSLDQSDVSKMVIHFAGSGGLVSFTEVPIPEPGAATLFLVGFMVIGSAIQRQRR